MPTFQNRIIKYGVKPADQFLANPDNPRIHPQFQRQVMEAALTSVGFVAPVIETSDGYLLDGHERIFQALANNSDVPYVVLDIDSKHPDAAYVLATFDPITSLASYDTGKLDALLQEVNSDSPAIQQMLDRLAVMSGLYEPQDPSAEWQGMPEFENADLTDGAVFTIRVFLKDADDLAAFGRLLGKDLTGKKFVWFSKQPIGDVFEVHDESQS